MQAKPELQYDELQFPPESITDLEAWQEQEAIEERLHLSNVVSTFEQYATFAYSANNRRRKDYHRLPLEDKQLLESVGVAESYKRKLSEVDECIRVNAEFLSMLVRDVEIYESDDEGYSDQHMMQNGEPSHTHSHTHNHHPHSDAHPHPYDDIPISMNLTPPATPSTSRRVRPRYKPTENDIEKLQSTLKQCVRDWSSEGAEEREACYTPLLEALAGYFDARGVHKEDRYKKRVLVPGAGLGRLVYEVAYLGFSSQGNEFSHYMLFPSFFILNRTNRIEEHTIYPFIHSFLNAKSPESILRPIRIPDVVPSDVPKNVHFSYVAGDFEQVYGAVPGNQQGLEVQDGEWDAVVTSFFIDTAKNIVNYLRIIHRLLADDGVWVNLGPLLWHFENNADGDISIELGLEEVKELARGVGFIFLEERMIKTGYVANKLSMLSHTYESAFWVAVKLKAEVTGGHNIISLLD